MISAPAEVYAKSYWETMPYNRAMQTCRIHDGFYFARKNDYEYGIIALLHEANRQAWIRIELLLKKRHNRAYNDYITEMTVGFNNGSTFTFPAVVRTTDKVDTISGYLPHSSVMQEFAIRNWIGVNVANVVSFRHHLKNTSREVPRFMSCARYNGADDAFFANYNPREGSGTTSSSTSAGIGNSTSDQSSDTHTSRSLPANAPSRCSSIPEISMRSFARPAGTKTI